MQLDVISWFLLTLFIGVFADKRLVIQDSLVCLFQNVTADNAEKEVTLYASGVEHPTRIVTFKFVNGHISVDWDLHMANNYINIFMDAKRNIWIANMDETYEKKFYIYSSKILGEVELTILKTSSSQIRDSLSDKRTVERGSLVRLFENVVADNTEKEVNLYVNGVEYPTIVVTFKFENDGFIIPVWKTDNYSKIFMDAKRNIFIANMDETYERKFYIYSSKILGEVELTILRNLTGEQIGESRKLVDDHTELIKEYLDFVKKHGIIGQDTNLFNIDNDCAEPSLYNETEKVVASWNANTYTVAYMDPHYSGKIFMDKKRNIWIFDVERKDAGKYYLKCGIQSKGLEMTLTVKEELTEEQPQECRNNHPDFTKKDGWNPLSLGMQIVTFIIVTIMLLMKLENVNPIRKGLINMKDWIQKNLCSRHMPENEPQNQENESLIKVSGETILKLPQPSKKDKVVPAADETNVKDLSSLRRKGGRIHDQS